ncbi:MAG: response regulator [Gloeomargarita sp. SKYG116]|nr:response regulator [Gloeomargarita sp. SKYG116]MCS7226068.1 response regulator [Gloeomargarita sp. SKYB31]MDW8401241.1 adenylate/guanylate cyclase domain-containing protein [Gloeomargarita sp. SKYGB_i_bin116]
MAATANPLQEMNILIVDDSPSQRLSLVAILKAAGFRHLYSCDSAQEAFALLQQQPVDLILMDISMPRMDGIEACRILKNQPEHHDIPVIMVTASVEVSDLESAFEAGATDYIVKPPHQIELLARVRSCLRLKHETDQRKAKEVQLRQALASLDEQHRLLRLEQEKSERLLLNILPKPVAERLKQGQQVIADDFAAVTVLFADIVDFTSLAARMPAQEVVALLNAIFSRFDQLAERHGLEKIKTIGDAYMVVGGLPTPRPDHARAVAAFALDVMRMMTTPEPTKQLPQVRIGMHTGPVVAGVIGTKKFIYDLWGDTVNTASRMQMVGQPNTIQVSEATYHLLKEEFVLQERGLIPVKGKGEMRVYYLLGQR